MATYILVYLCVVNVRLWALISLKDTQLGRTLRTNDRAERLPFSFCSPQFSCWLHARPARKKFSNFHMERSKANPQTNKL